MRHDEGVGGRHYQGNTGRSAKHRAGAAYARDERSAAEAKIHLGIRRRAGGMWGILRASLSKSPFPPPHRQPLNAGSLIPTKFLRHFRACPPTETLAPSLLADLSPNCRRERGLISVSGGSVWFPSGAPIAVNREIQGIRPSNQDRKRPRMPVKARQAAGLRRSAVGNSRI